MTKRERQIRGRRKLIQLLSDPNPTHILNAIQQLPPLGSRARFKSNDADIDEYFSYIGSMPLDELPDDERTLIIKAITILSFAIILELDVKSVSSDYETKIYNLSNNEFIPSPEVWFLPGGYYYARVNYAKISETKKMVGARQRLYRIEIYSAKHVIKASGNYRFWLLLHLWEEVVINGTEVRMINLDELPAEIYSDLAKLDFQLLSDVSGDGRLFKHTDEFMRFEGLGGISDKALIRQYVDLMHDDSILRASRPLDINELRALCIDWQDKELLECLERWEQIRTKAGNEKAIGYIISELKVNDITSERIRSRMTHKVPEEPSSSHPKAFISYSWDDDKHKDWVRELATRLRREGGVDVTLDCWHAAPGTQLPQFMERAVRENDFVLIVCTPRYKRKSEERIGGVGYEGDIMTGEVFVEGNDYKFIPLLRSGNWSDAAPSWLRGKNYIDLRGEIYPEDEYQRLLNALHRRDETPPLGPVPSPDKSLIGPLPIRALPTTVSPGAEKEKRLSQRFCLLPKFESDSFTDFSGRYLLEKLLSFIWKYPLQGESSKSWAVKDSALMLEKQPDAIDKPSLGVAIVSTHFAKDVYGPQARPRVEECVRWALLRSQLGPPYLIQVEEIKQITYRRTLEPDYRHTISLGIVLARWQLHLDLQECYMKIALESQNKEDGGWQAENSYPVSEIFTVLYSVEFLDLCSRDERLLLNARREAAASRDRGLDWLVQDIGQRPLWGSMIMYEYSWDVLWTSSWMIHRLVSSLAYIPDQLLDCIKRALPAMTRMCKAGDTWQRSTEAQIFRVKARVAAAVSVSKNRFQADLSSHILDELNTFIEDWRDECVRSIAQTKGLYLDLATSIFVATSLTTPDELSNIWKSIIDRGLSV